MTDDSHTALVQGLIPAVRATVEQAGRMAMSFFVPGARTSARVWSKAGGSPVTEADVSVDTFLKVRLSQVLPEAGWLSEETRDDLGRLGRDLIWIVDPIDGTRSFLNGRLDWSVAVALLDGDRPVLGFVYAAAHEAMYEAVRGGGARRNGAAIQVSTVAEIKGARTTGPRPLVDQLDHVAGPLERVDKISSLALRLARVADGTVDVGLVSGDARDWDIAAADLVLEEAGGRLGTLTGAVPRYNLREPLHGELVAAPRGLHPGVVAAMTARPRPAAALA